MKQLACESRSFNADTSNSASSLIGSNFASGALDYNKPTDAHYLTQAGKSVNVAAIVVTVMQLDN